MNLSSSSRFLSTLATALVLVFSLSLAFTPANARAGAEALDAFAKAIQSDSTITAAQQKAMRAILAQARADPAQAALAIPQCLAMMSDDYRAGMEAFADGDTKKALPIFTRLMESPQPWLAAHAQFDLARLHVYDENFEAAQPLLAALVKDHLSYIVDNGECLFLLGTAENRLMMWPDAKTHLDQFLQDQPTAPERMRSAAQIMRAELDLFEEGSLTDVAAHMQTSRRLLDLEETGTKTRDTQKKIVAMLDKMIKEAEDQNNQSSGSQGSGSSSGGQPKPGNGPPMPGPPTGNQKSTKPAEVAATVAGEGRIGTLGKVARGEAGESWGNARSRERGNVLNADKTQIPDRYRSLLEQYYKSLQQADR